MANEPKKQKSPKYAQPTAVYCFGNGRKKQCDLVDVPGTENKVAYNYKSVNTLSFLIYAFNRNEYLINY